MTASLALLGWGLAAGVLAVLALAWAGVTGVAAPGGGWAARVLIGLTAALAIWPGLLARQTVDGYGLGLLAGITPILVAAAACLLRLRREEALRRPAQVALAAAAHLWLALAAGAAWQG